MDNGIRTTEPQFDSELAQFRRYPAELADKLTGMIKPFYGWEPKLKPTVPDLQMKARRATRWYRIKGIKTYALCDVALLQASLQISFGDALRSVCKDMLYGEHWSLLEQTLSTRLQESLSASIEESLLIMLRDALFLSLFYAYGLALVGMPQQGIDFKPELDLWLAGNFPVGFDKDGNLLVLVA